MCERGVAVKRAASDSGGGGHGWEGLPTGSCVTRSHSQLKQQHPAKPRACAGGYPDTP